MKSPNRWPLPPPKGVHCDAHVGTGYDRQGKPVVYRCRNLAVESVMPLRGVLLATEMWLCADCVPALVKKRQVYRNPRKFPPPKERTP